MEQKIDSMHAQQQAIAEQLSAVLATVQRLEQQAQQQPAR